MVAWPLLVEVLTATVAGHARARGRLAWRRLGAGLAFLPRVRVRPCSAPFDRLLARLPARPLARLPACLLATLAQPARHRLASRVWLLLTTTHSLPTTPSLLFRTSSFLSLPCSPPSFRFPSPVPRTPPPPPPNEDIYAPAMLALAPHLARNTPRSR